ncbi:hypothetical protein OG792_05135 [Micromonospora sp. NBC_01699]|uniref:hypothetical protein n=1 Tax=Micromonospora sp. NBC_01699 TaxID=2975984 RepID=UPI002E356DFE|nr:hypothetical protein [Micromonospora sp. NBC_01699]
MDNLMYFFLLDVPRAAVIWSALIVVALVAMAVLIARRPGPELTDGAVPESGRKGGPIRAAVAGRARLTAEAEELARYADEVAVAAGRAAETARRRREEWLAAQDDAETAWQAYESADADARRVAATTYLPVPRTPRTPAEYADRERYLHRAALSACGRRELSVLELGDALAHRNGWDPRRHPVEQEVILRRAVRDGRLAAQRRAAERERATWRTAEAAAVAARSLRDEAFAAAERARAASHLLPPGGGPGSTPGTSVRDVSRPVRPATRWRPVSAG